MGIHIQLAGERIGPFSEARVRQYLQEGLVSPTDLATVEGSDDWQAVDVVLAKLPPSAPESAMTTGPIADPDPAVLGDSAPASAASAVPPPPQEKPETTPLTPERFLAFAAAQKAKRKPIPGKIVIEPIRPTTALPPVSSFTPKEKTATKALPKVGQVSLKDVPGKISAATEKPDTAVKPESVEEFQPPPINPAPGPKDTEGQTNFEIWFARILRGAFYVCCGLALFLVYLVFSFLYHLSLPHDTGHQAVLLPSEAVPASSETAGNIEDPKTAADFVARAGTRQINGDFEGALTDYNQALTLDPKNALASYRRGLIRQAKGDLNGALADFNVLLGLEPRNGKYYGNRAYVKQSLGDVDGAIADYNQAIALNPRNSVAYYNLGLIKVQKGDIDGAIAAYDEALTLDPKMAIAYYNRGNAKNSENNVDGAIADYTQALVLSPKIIPAYVNRGSLRQAKDDLDGALADYAQALALNPKITLVYCNRGVIRIQKGDLDGAIDDSSAAIDLDSKSGQAYSNRGLARFGKGNLDGALADLRKFCELAPRDSGADLARLYLWIIATQINPKGTADQDLSVALQNDWNSTPEDFSSKIASFLLGHMRESELIANAASPDPKLEPGQYCKAWYFAGMKRLLAGDKKTAITYFQKSVATDQNEFCEYLFSKTELQNLGQGGEAVPQASIAQ